MATRRSKRAGSRPSPAAPPTLDEIPAEISTEIVEGPPVVVYDVLERDEEPPTLFDDSPEDSYVLVNRLGIDKQWAFFTKLLPEEATTDKLAELGGGGTYRCRETVPTGTGAFVMKRQRTIKVEGPRKELREYPVKTEGTAAPMAPTMPGVDPTSIANAETQRVLTERLLAHDSRPEVAHTDWGKIVPAIVPAILTFMQAMIDRKPEPAPDPIDLVTKIAAVFKENTSPMSNMKENLDMMMSVLDLQGAAKELRAESEPGDPLMDTITANVPKVLALMEGQKAAGTTPPAPTPTQSAPVATLPAPTTEGPMWAQFLISKKPQLLAMARDGKNPEVCADALLELMLPVEYRGQLAEFMQRPDALELVLQSLPELQQYQQWTADFLNRLYEDLFGSVEVVEDEAEEVVVDSPEEPAEEPQPSPVVSTPPPLTPVELDELDSEG